MDYKDSLIIISIGISLYNLFKDIAIENNLPNASLGSFFSTIFLLIILAGAINLNNNINQKGE